MTDDDFNEEEKLTALSMGMRPEELRALRAMARKWADSHSFWSRIKASIRILIKGE